MVSARLAAVLGSALAAGLALITISACDVVLGLPDRHFDPHVACDGGGCVCAPGFADCDQKPDNGCEADLTRLATCGACGHDCRNGTCVMAACACDTGFADCDQKPENGCEVELAKDVANCGACGHDCLGGVCEAGVCQPVVMGKFVMPQSFALSGSSLYVGVCQTPSLFQIPVAGGTAVPAAISSACPFLMSIVGSTLYWGSDTDIYATQLGAVTAPTKLVPNSNSVLFFAASATQIYWYSFDNTTMTQALMRAPTAGGPAVVIAPGAQVNCIVTDAARGYWADTAGIHSVPHDDTTVTLIEPPSALSALALAVDASNLYIGDTSQVKRRPLAGGAAKQLATASFVDAITVDADHVYWADSQNGDLSKVPIAGGSAKVLATGQTFDMGMQLYVDGQAVYWLADMQVRKVAK